MQRAPIVFLPPEMIQSLNPEMSNAEGSEDQLDGLSAWDVAMRYHELKSKKSLKHRAPELRALSVRAVMQRAQAVMGSVTHPVRPALSLWNEVPHQALDPEIDVEETLEASGAATDEVWMNYRIKTAQSVVVALDTSLSMTGDKLALTAVALAVVLLQFPEDPVGMIAFENEATILKHHDEKVSVEKLIARFLDVPCQGYTHLEEGMKSALRMCTKMRRRGVSPPSVILLTDGKYTAGRDPSYLASRFEHLVVVKMGKDRAGTPLCRDLAQRGHGQLKEVSELEQLPSAMYSIVKELLRGQSKRSIA